MTGSLTKLIILILLAVLLAVIYHSITFKFDYMGYGDKIWAHRVNSLEKLEYVQGRYAGIELDLVFEEQLQSFDVNHPPAVSIGLTLDSYLSKYDPAKTGGIWLDFKNLSVENAESSLKKLLLITEKHGLDKNLIIVESQHPEFLGEFEQAGFKTSYYLPVFLHSLTEGQLNEKLQEIKQNIANHPTTAISTNIVDYEIISKHFPNKTKYLWSIDKTYTTRMFKNFFLTRKALSDPKVDVLLVRVNRQVGHR